MDLEKAKEIMKIVGIEIKGNVLCCNGINHMNVPIENIDVVAIDPTCGIDITFYTKTRNQITYDTTDHHGVSEKDLNTALGIIISTF